MRAALERRGDRAALRRNPCRAAEQREFARRQPAQGQHHVVLHAQRRKQIGDLEGAGDAELRAAVRRQLRDVVTVEHDPAAGRRHHPRDSVEQRSLAGAVRADDGAALAARHGQADIVDRAQRVEGNHSICQRAGSVRTRIFPVGALSGRAVPAITVRTMGSDCRRDAAMDRAAALAMDQAFLMPWKVRE